MRAAIAALLIVVAGVLAVEATMQPTGDDRITLLAIFASIALVAVGLARAIPGLTRRLRSLSAVVLAVALAAVGVAALAVLASSSLMFLSSHDLRLTLVALGFGVALAAVLAAAVARPITRDLASVSEAVRRVAEGDLTSRTDVDRPDEIGRTAAAVDDMIRQLAQARAERDGAETARQLFMAAVGHDLRTPLTSMRAAVEALQDGIAPDPSRYLAAIERDLEMLGSMVEDFFLLARIDAGKLEFDSSPIDLAELADDAVEAMIPVAARRSITLSLDSSGRVTVRGGSRELSRVLRNILDNAIRHAPEASTVRVRVEQEPAAGRVVVSDEGPGFPPEFRSRALDHFARADPARTRSGGAAGLGLAIARGVVEAHGGQIWIEDGPGGRVAFRIPVTSV